MLRRAILAAALLAPTAVLAEDMELRCLSDPQADRAASHFEATGQIPDFTWTLRVEGGRWTRVRGPGPDGLVRPNGEFRIASQSGDRVVLRLLDDAGGRAMINLDLKSGRYSAVTSSPAAPVGAGGETSLTFSETRERGVCLSKGLNILTDAETTGAG